MFWRLKMGAKNAGKEWNKEDVLEFWNTPEAGYKELAEKLGREKTALDTMHVTKKELLKISSFIKPKTSKPDRYMFELFIEGIKPRM